MEIVQGDMGTASCPDKLGFSVFFHLAIPDSSSTTKVSTTWRGGASLPEMTGVFVALKLLARTSRY
jgi:hypothetical protein